MKPGKLWLLLVIYGLLIGACGKGKQPATSGSIEPAATAPAVQRDSSLYAECVRQPIVHPNTTLLSCRNWLLGHSTVSLGGESGQVVASVYIEGVSRSASCTKTGQATEKQIDSVSYWSQSLRCGQTEAASSTVEVVWLYEDPMQIFSCNGSSRDTESEARCERVIKDLLRHGAPQDIPAAPSPQTPLLVGRPVAVPDGCEVTVAKFASGVYCPAEKSMVEWIQISEASTPEFLNQAAEQFKNKLETTRPSPAWSQAEMSCTVEGAQGRCWRHTQPVEGEDSFRVAVLAFGEFRGIGILVKCLYRGAENAGFPPLCQDILTVR